MKGVEFEELKNGPQEGEVSDCSHETDCKNKGGVCRNTTAFYSVGWMPETNTGNYYYFLQPGNRNVLIQNKSLII